MTARRRITSRPLTVEVRFIGSRRHLAREVGKFCAMQWGHPALLVPEKPATPDTAPAAAGEEEEEQP